MNANAIISEDMTLDQKLAAIDAAMANAMQQTKDDARTGDAVFAPLDPADLTMCQGCQ